MNAGICVQKIADARKPAPNKAKMAAGLDQQRVRNLKNFGELVIKVEITRATKG